MRGEVVDAHRAYAGTYMVSRHASARPAARCVRPRTSKSRGPSRTADLPARHHPPGVHACSSVAPVQHTQALWTEGTKGYSGSCREPRTASPAVSEEGATHRKGVSNYSRSLSAYQSRRNWTGWKRNRRCGTGAQTVEEAVFSVERSVPIIRRWTDPSTSNHSENC